MMQGIRTNTDRLLSEFMTINSHYSKHPELLKGDLPTAQAFDKLMAVKDANDLKDWLRMMATSDRSKNLPRNYGVVWEDTLGRAEQTAMKMDDKELELVANAMARIAENGYHSTLENDLKVLERQRKALTKKFPDAIVLYRHGDGYFTFGDDADTLFEKLAWQTSSKPVGDGAVSWMNINDDGMKVLRLYDIDMITAQPNVEIHLDDYASDEEYKDDQLLQAQQVIDSIRGMNPERDAVISLGQYQVLSEENGIDTSVSIDFIRLAYDDVSIINDSGREQRLVDGLVWYADSHNRDYITATGEMLQNNEKTVEHLLHHYDDVTLGRQLRTDSVKDEYDALKSESPDRLLLVKQWNFYEAMGDDAIRIASQTNYPLWDRDAGNGKMVPVVMLRSLQVDRVEAELGEENVRLKESNIKETLNYMALRPSPLNDGLHSELHFNECGIKKTRSGEYQVWARMNGVDLPDKAIPTDIGLRYSRLTPGAEKEITLRTALQQSYGSTLLQMAQKSQSAVVKI